MELETRVLLVSGKQSNQNRVSYSKIFNKLERRNSLSLYNHILFQPTRTLYVPRVSRAGAAESEDAHDDDESYVDVVSEPVKSQPSYDMEKARKGMGECEKFTCFTRPSFASLNLEDEKEDMMGWEERVPKENWSPGQGKLYSKVMKVLQADRCVLIYQ